VLPGNAEAGHNAEVRAYGLMDMPLRERDLPGNAADSQNADCSGSHFAPKTAQLGFGLLCGFQLGWCLAAR
jgi:hypothetical protein